MTGEIVSLVTNFIACFVLLGGFVFGLAMIVVFAVIGIVDGLAALLDAAMTRMRSK